MPRIATQDGGTIAYLDMGQGRPIVFLHGWGTGGRFFRRQCSDLATNYRVIAPDLRGHGDSSELPDGDGITTLAKDTLYLLEALDLNDVVLCGWSMGAMVIWKILAEYPHDRICGIVAEDMSPKVLDSADWVHGLKRARKHKAKPNDVGTHSNPFFQLPWPSICEKFIPRIFADGGSVENGLLTQAIRDASVNHPESMRQLWDSLIEQDYRHSLSRIPIPVLVLFGAKSQLYGAQTSQWVCQQIPDCRRVCFEQSGHAPHLEEPERFNQLVKDFADLFQKETPGDKSPHLDQQIRRI